MRLHEILGVKINKIFQCSIPCGKAEIVDKYWCIIDSLERFDMLFSTNSIIDEKDILCALIDNPSIINDVDYPAFSIYKNFLKNINGLFNLQYFKIEVNSNSEFVIYFSKSDPGYTGVKPSKVYISPEEYEHNCLWLFFYKHNDCYININEEIFLLGG